jgi:hypothetical protein
LSILLPPSTNAQETNSDDPRPIKEERMKYIKMLGLLAVAAAALMAFAGSASATEIKSSTGSTPTIHAEAGTTTLHGVTDIICHNSTVAGTVSEHVSGTPKGSISTLTFGNCTQHVTVLTDGSGANGTGTLEVHAAKKTGDGVLTSNGTRVTVTITSLGLSCLFETQNTTIGTVTGGKTAELDIESAGISRVGHSIFCGDGVWTGSYSVTHPTNLEIH